MRIFMQRNILQIFILTIVLSLLSWQSVYAGKWIKTKDSGCWIWNPHPVMNEYVAYTGDCHSGIADGIGMVAWYIDGKRSSTCSGQFKNGRQRGKERCTSYGTDPNGVKFKDVWTGQIKNGKRYGAFNSTLFINGRKLISKSVYYKNGKRDGTLIQTWFKDSRNYATVEGTFKTDELVSTLLVTTYENGKKRKSRNVSIEDLDDILRPYRDDITEGNTKETSSNKGTLPTDGHLTRSDAKKIFLDSNWDVVAASVNKENVDTGKMYNFLTEQGFIKAKQVLFTTEVKPTKKLLPYTMSGGNVGISLFGMVTDVSSFWYGNIKDVHVTGISPSSKYEATVELEAILDLTEIGKILDNANRVAIILKYQYYDDGWRIKEPLWDEIRKKNRAKRIVVKGFYSKSKATDMVLKNMHDLGEYSDNYMELAGVLESSGYYPFLKAAAWAYYDHGYRTEAVNLFRNRVLPVVRKKGTTLEIEEYEKEFKKIQSINKEPNEYQNIVLFATDDYIVKSCSFYENKDYKISFAKPNARYIGVEVKFQNLQFGKKNHSHTIKRIYYYPNDTSMASPDEELLTINKDRGWATYSQGWGWKDPGHWKTGTYHVEIFIDGVKVARKAFSIDEIEDSSWNKEYLKNIHNYKGIFEYNSQPIYNIDKSGRLFTNELSSEILDPSRPVLVTGICPFECCQLGSLITTDETPVYNRPEGDPMRMLIQGEPVFAVASIIKTLPLQATVTRVYKSDTEQGLNIGSTINVLCPLGEGAMAVYHNGKLIEGSLDLNFKYDKTNNSNKKRWTWWVKIILENGDTGWLKDPRQFKGMDGCSAYSADINQSEFNDKFEKIVYDKSVLSHSLSHNKSCEEIVG